MSNNWSYLAGRDEEHWGRSIQPKFRPVRPGKVVHLKRWTSFFETFPVGPNRSIACEQVLLFGRVKRVLRERASEPRSRVLARLASLAQVGELACRLTDPLSYGPKCPDILVEWSFSPRKTTVSRQKSQVFFWTAVPGHEHINFSFSVLNGSSRPWTN